MVTSVPSLLVPPIAFAHRGARAHARENTIEAFALALRLGATGLESDVWCTADGIAVLDHDGQVGSRLRRRSIGDVNRAQLPAHIPALEELYAECGTDFELSLDVKDPAAIDATVAAGRAAGVPERMWLCHHDWHLLGEWRPRFEDVRLVDSTRLRYMRNGPERRASQLADAGIDAVNMHESDWTGGLTTLFHRFNVYAFGWDAQFDRVLDNLLTMGVDGVYSDHVDRMMEAFARSDSAD